MGEFLRSVAGLLGGFMGLCRTRILSGWLMFCLLAGQRIIEKLCMKSAYHEKHGKHGNCEKLCIWAISQSEKLQKSVFSVESASAPRPTVKPVRVFPAFLRIATRLTNSYIYIHSFIREFLGFFRVVHGGAQKAPPRVAGTLLACPPRWGYSARHGNSGFLDTG